MIPVPWNKMMGPKGSKAKEKQNDPSDVQGGMNLNNMGEGELKEGLKAIADGLESAAIWIALAIVIHGC